jgi:TrmH family RNA methyltransferase
VKLDDIKKLQQKKYRAQFGHYLAEGEHLVLELQKAALREPGLRGSQLYVTEAYAHWQSEFNIHVVSDRQMAQLSDTESPQGIIAVVPIAPVAESSSAIAGERAIYLHEIQDPGNLGTILRTLAWFGGFRCLLSPGSVDPYNAKVVRASMGGIFHVPLDIEVELASLSSRFTHLACLDMAGEKPSAPDFTSFDCYVFGNEARGIPRQQLQELAARPFAIAGCAAVESLNLAAVVNMCVYELTR